MAEDIIVPVAFFLVIGFSYYFYLRTRSKERLACIEKGINVMPAPGKSRDIRKTIFTIGLFMIGIAVGLLFAFLLWKYLNIENACAIPSMLLLFGGISLVISNFIKFKKEE